MGKPKYLEENLPQGPLSLPHLTHDSWEKTCSCYFGGGEKLACLVDDDDDGDAVSLQQPVLPVFILLHLNTHAVIIILWLQSSRMFLSQPSW